MSDAPDPLDWLLLRISLAVVGLAMFAVAGAWTVHEVRKPPEPTRLALNVRCLHDEKGVVAVVPAGDPLADSAGDGSFRATIEGNDVTVALASSVEEAIRIAGYYNDAAGDLAVRLESRHKTVFLWKFESSPTQRQTMYDCQY